MYIVLIALLFFCIAFYDAVIERKYTVYSRKINNDVKIVMISDLHSMYHGKNQTKLIERINKAKPDIIALAGDIFDGRRSDEAAVCFIKNIPKDIPCFYVTGNHEHKRGRWREYYKFLEENGVNVLDAKSVHLEKFNITVSGIADPFKKEIDEPDYDYKAIIEKKLKADGKSYNIFLAHTPFHVEDYKKGGFDLILSGHTHGGQVRIPFLLNGLYSHSHKKRFGFFPNYCGGMYRHGELVHIVGRGISNNPAWAPRVFNRREFVVITIKKL